MTLKDFFEQVPKAAAAFSGGTDSAFVLWAAKKYGCDIHAYYVKTAFQPGFELEDARRLAAELDIPMTVVDMDILSVYGAEENGPERCYYCKRAIFTRLRDAAQADGYAVLLDGTNASDDAGDRPGMRALHELQVRSPLRECGITKAQVRERSKEAGLFTWDKPAYASLPRGSPRGHGSGTEIWKEWSRRRRLCLRWASGTSGCACTKTARGFRLRETRCSLHWRNEKKYVKSWGGCFQR